MLKIKRQSKIVELIKTRDIDTQEELGELLKEAGYDVTQATISRDIRELKITKISVGGNKQRYSIVGDSRDRFTEKFLRVFREAATRIDHTRSGVVIIKTLEGMAMAASMCVDALDFPEILGTVAGVDTIACFTRDEEMAVLMVSKLKAIVRGDEVD